MYFISHFFSHYRNMDGVPGYMLLWITHCSLKCLEGVQFSVVFLWICTEIIEVKLGIWALNFQFYFTHRVKLQESRAHSESPDNVTLGYRHLAEPAVV